MLPGLPATGIDSSLLVSTAAGGFDRPHGLALTSDGRHLLVSEKNAHRIKRVDLATSAVSVLAGTGNRGAVDGAPPLAAPSFRYPIALALTSDDSTVFVADNWNHKLRSIELRSTFAARCLRFPSSMAPCGTSPTPPASTSARQHGAPTASSSQR